MAHLGLCRLPPPSISLTSSSTATKTSIRLFKRLIELLGSFDNFMRKLRLEKEKNMEDGKWEKANVGPKTKKLNISRPTILGQLGKWGFLIETTQDESPEDGLTQEKKRLPYPLILNPVNMSLVKIR
jgi:hypothetical protein